MRIQKHVGHIQTSQGIAGSVCACVDALDFLKGNVSSSGLLLQGSVIAGSLGSMRNISRVGKFIAGADRVEEPYGLVRARGHEQLSFAEVANVYDGAVVGLETTEDWYIPGRVSLEQFNQVSLDVPDEDL